jgi:hypothetical protein
MGVSLSQITKMCHSTPDSVQAWRNECPSTVELELNGHSLKSTVVLGSREDSKALVTRQHHLRFVSIRRPLEEAIALAANSQAKDCELACHFH